MRQAYFVFLLMLTLGSCNSKIASIQKEKIPPNVLFIAIDDLNDWIGCMNGHPNAKTPNIDRLATQGTLFTNAHCQAPICGPSRASLMSGLRPSTTGIYGQIVDKDLAAVPALGKDIIYLPQYFGQQGYKTMGKGKLFHKHAPEGVFEISEGREKGFGPKPKKRFKYDPKWFGKPGGTSTDWGAFPNTDEEMPDFRTAKWGIEQLKIDHDKPFFLAVGFVRPHVPWYAPQKWFDKHPIEGIQTPPYLKEDLADVPEISKRVHDIPMMPSTEWAKENGHWKDICQAYLACTSFVDFYVGEVLNALEASKYAENTIIILWSDHGYHLGEKNRFAKHSNWERSSKVPMIIAGNGLPKNQRTNQPVELLDMYPTLLDLCDLPPNSSNEGLSFKRLIEQPKQKWKKPAITTYGKNNHAIQTDRYRYMIYADGSEELYDHQTDPNEWTNIATDPSFTALKKELQQYLPTKNVDWAKVSTLKVNDYFKPTISKLPK